MCVPLVYVFTIVYFREMVVSKWVINLKEFQGYRFGDNGELYKLPFNKNGRRYSLRKLKQQYPSRWYINGVFWSKKQLKPHIEIDKVPILLEASKENTPNWV